MIERGKFIVIEGTDASGKTTQFELMQQKMEAEIGQIMIADFPRYYNSVWGKVIGQLLKGDHGDFISVTPYLTALPYMIDQYTWSRDEGWPHQAKGGWILSNRYFTSNVHQVAKLEEDRRAKFRDWIWTSGYDELGILKPDLVLFMDVPPEVGQELNQKKKSRSYLEGKKSDLAESNSAHQQAAYEEYHYMVQNEKSWVRVACVTKRQIDTPETIHERAWDLVKGRFEQLGK